MAERPEDLNLPISVVQRIIKEALPDGVIVSKEARQTISRAASVFVLYLTACAVTHTNKAKRKTLAVTDIISAMTDMEFESFVAPLNEALKTRKEALSLIASNKKPANKSKSTENVDEEAVDDGEPEVIEIEENEEVDNEEENEEDENEKSVSAKPTVKKRKLSEKEGEEKKKASENLEIENKDGDDEEEEEGDSDVEKIN